MRAFIGCLILAFGLSFGIDRALASSTSGPYSLELVDETGNALPTFWKEGRTYVLGAQGRRYALRIRNQSGARVEFVASVDGRDVLDGRPSSWDKRGYIVAPSEQVVIDGFRLDSESVAAFRFSSVKDSYAAQMGNAREVGVIGVAVFPERRPRFQPPLRRSYLYDEGAAGSGAIGELSRGAAAPASAPAADKMLAGSDAAKKAERSGLGTEFGEERSSHVDQVAFQRAGSQPAALLSVRYNDREGLRAMGVDLDPSLECREADLRESAEPFRRNYSQPPPGWNR